MVKRINKSSLVRFIKTIYQEIKKELKIFVSSEKLNCLLRLFPYEKIFGSTKP
jgi:hypothetical protein